MVDLLVGLHIFPEGKPGCHVRPDDVPVEVGSPGVFAANLPVEICFGNFFYDIVNCIKNVEYNPRWRPDNLRLLFLFLLLICNIVLGALLDHFLGRWRRDKRDVFFGYMEHLL